MRRCWRAAALLVMLSITASTHAGVEAAQVAGSTVTVRQQGGLTLLRALQDPTVNTIQLDGDYSVADELKTPLYDPIQLGRNLTIQGRLGAQPPTNLDLAFKRAVVVLCPTCMLTLAHLTLSNARRGTGAAIDFIVGDDLPSVSAVLLEDVHRMRVACTPGTDAAEVLEDVRRSKDLPNPKGRQVLEVKNVTVQGVHYANALYMRDFTQDLPLTHLEGRGHNSTAHFGGYALGSKNVLYLCQHLASEACLAEKPPDVCINEIIDSVLSGPKQASTGAGLSGPLIAAIVVPIVLVGAIAAALLVWGLRRRRRRQQELLPLTLHRRDSASSVSPHTKAAEFSGASVADMGSGVDLAMEVYSKAAQQGGRSSLEFARQPHGSDQGWQLISSNVAPHMQDAVDEATAPHVDFGAFVGAGSYGRVYRARWAGRDVAVKVIDHDKTTLAVVEAEASLMLSLSHPNVVRALYYCTFVCARTERAGRPPGRPSFSQQRQLKSSASGTTGAASHAGEQPSTTSTVPPPGSSHGGSSNGGSGAGALALQEQRRRQQSLSSEPGRPPQPPQQQQQQHKGGQSSGQLLRGPSVDTNASCDTSKDAAATTAAAGVGAMRAAAASPASATYDAASKASSSGSGPAAKRTVGFLLDTDHSGSSLSGGGGSGKRSGKVKAETWLVQEFCDMGTLGHVASVWEPEQECDEQMLERLLLLRDTAEGLALLHGHHVVHGDLNCRNVLVASCESAKLGMIAKVADLGLSRCLQHHATHRTTNSCGTLSHMAPELLRHGRMSTAVDVYAFGIMMWELYHAAKPAFDKLHYGQFFETVVLRNVRPCVPAGMPPDYELLMRACWTAEPGERPPVAKLLQCLDIMIAQRERVVSVRRRSCESTGERAAARAAAEAAGGDAGAGGASPAPSVSPPTTTALDALVELLQPQEDQLQAILQQQEQHKQQRLSSDEVRDLSSGRLSVLTHSLLYTPGEAPAAAAAAAAAEDADAAHSVMVIGEQEQQQRQQQQQPQPQPQRSFAARLSASARVSTSHTATTGSVASCGRGEGEGPLLDAEVSTHGGNRLWFV